MACWPRSAEVGHDPTHGGAGSRARGAAPLAAARARASRPAAEHPAAARRPPGSPGCSRRCSALATFVSRLWGITYPRDLLFDEAYYPPEAHELLTWGFEYNRGYSFIVHPPLGKWFIAAGEQLFGYN